MVHRAMHFTPQVLLSAPRRSAGVPNPSGTKILYTTSTYCFETHKKTTELRVLEVQTGESFQLAKDDDISDLNWLDDDAFVCLQAEKDSTTKVFWASVSKTIGGAKLGEGYYVAGTVDAPAANLKVKKLKDGGFAVVLSAEASPDGGLFNPKKAKKTHATGKLYKSLFVRHWDRWETKQKNALWFGKLSRNGHHGKYELSTLTNAMKGRPLECPIRPFGGADNFDLTHDRIIFVTKDPELNPALNTKCNVYILNVPSWTGEKETKLTQIYWDNLQGACTSPVFSPDGDSVAFLGMKTNGYEADKNEIFLLYNVRTQVTEQTTSVKAERLSIFHEWDRSPSSISFTPDGKSLVFVAEDAGAAKLFEITPKRLADPRLPKPLTSRGSISEVHCLQDGRVFVSGSSLIDNSFFAIVDRTATTATMAWTHSNSGEGDKFGLKSAQVSDVWTPASNPYVNKEVHSIVVRPSNFNSDKKYPVAYVIHGGPQGAWADSWSTRWNLAVFAEQGYIVIAPNPTGSTGYGQAFTDSIRRNWGGDPYQDIVNVFEWVGENMPEADNDRAVALGASYGGYMMNWIQGHDLGRKFKCLVCHDGITSFAGAMLGTEELYFPLYDLGGTPWYDPGFKPAPGDASTAAQGNRNFGSAMLSDWRKWDPSEHFANWSTPQLVIHSSRDFRLPIAEGLAAFNVLQARGVDSELLHFDDENHWVLKPENSLLWHKVVLNWINRYSGLEAFSTEDEESEAFYGGVEEMDREKDAEMPTQGRVEM
ncbi:Dipeptidyl-peptidase 5 [Lecanosticta acicola]|uniref:Dipeptidyl-peptidase V n=1 Tax=Lecanosticta acicola TaxID=111012 RepID=A0AAI8Z2M2_9PEZI|nr:Dipeptidyl-peptidase 5 [Lecanosticta acicola]